MAQRRSKKRAKNRTRAVTVGMGREARKIVSDRNGRLFNTRKEQGV